MVSVRPAALRLEFEATLRVGLQGQVWNHRPDLIQGVESPLVESTLQSEHDPHAAGQLVSLAYRTHIKLTAGVGQESPIVAFGSVANLLDNHLAVLADFDTDRLGIPFGF